MCIRKKYKYLQYKIDIVIYHEKYICLYYMYSLRPELSDTREKYFELYNIL
jgi:hypothetical protein